MSVGLPAALGPWAGSLTALTPRLSVALGPLIRRIDALAGEREPQTATDGMPDGYGGLARTTDPYRLLASEWLLAEEFPDEFARRLAESELLSLAPEFRSSRPRGKVAALVDCGPGQAGAGRLVQLAALVVLHRRAAARGTELVVGVLGDPAGEWLTGELPELLPRWLLARRDRDPDVADVRRADAALDGPDEAWLLTSPGLAGQLPARRRVLTAEPAEWGPDGVTRVRIALGGATAELPVPEREIAVRTLRGGEFRRSGAAPIELPPGSGLLLPTFNSSVRAVVARGGRANKLVVVKIPGRSHPPVARPVRHGFPGPVLAAARIGRRLIVLTVERDRLVTHVIGRPLGAAARQPVAREAVQLDDVLLGELLEQALLPVALDGEALLVPLAGHWWRLNADGSVAQGNPVGRALATSKGGPWFSWAHEPNLFEGEVPAAAAVAGLRLQSASAIAWRTGDGQWRAQAGSAPAVTIAVPPDDEVIGVAADGDTVGLVSVGMGGRLVRSLRPDGARVLNRFSGGPVPPVLHPSLPLIAAETRPGRLDIGDPLTGRVHLVIGSET